MNLEQRFIRPFIQVIASVGRYFPKRSVYKNWNRSDSSSVRKFVELQGETATVEETIQEIIKDSIRIRHKIRVVGSGHNFNDINHSDDIVISMAKCDKVLSFVSHDDFCEVRVQAGIKIYQLIEILRERGYCLTNIGNFNQQTIGGVLASATHGTAGKEASHIHDGIIQVRMIDGQGNIVTDLPRPLWCHLGLLGCITEVTLRAQREHSLEKTEEWYAVNDFAAEIETLMSRHEFIMFKMYVYSTHGRLMKYDRSSRKRTPMAKYYVKNIFNYMILPRVSSLLFERLGSGRYSRQVRNLFGRLYKTNLDHSIFVQSKSYVLADTCATTHHTESEWAVHRGDVGNIISALREQLSSIQNNYLIEIHIRFSSSSTLWMDPAYGRETAWVDLNVMKTGNFNYNNHETYHNTPLMRAVHEVMRNYQARPHWTKIHAYSAEEIAKLYPKYDEFRLACQQFDPHGIFRNVYSERVLGIG